MSHPYHGLNELRELFLKFFETKGHLRLPSFFAVVPQNDKSILLINRHDPHEAPGSRARRSRPAAASAPVRSASAPVTSTMWARPPATAPFRDAGQLLLWRLLQARGHRVGAGVPDLPEWVGLEADRLYPSVYESDDEAFAIWRTRSAFLRTGSSASARRTTSGSTAPAPAALPEIYYDRGPEYGCGKPGCTVGCDCDRYIEIWNNVFSQFDNDGHNNYTELKQKNIDTGMGLERLACVCQNVASLFDVDTVMNITHKVSELTGALLRRELQTGREPARHHRHPVATFHASATKYPAQQRGAWLRKAAPPAAARRPPRQAAGRQRAVPVQGGGHRGATRTMSVPRPEGKQSYHHQVIRTEEEKLRPHHRRRHPHLQRDAGLPTRRRARRCSPALTPLSRTIRSASPST